VSDRACSIACAFLKTQEGLRLKAYQDGGGRWSIGYGHAEGVKPGDQISEQRAEILLTKDAVGVWEEIEPHLPLTLTDYQRAALISFAFNIGCGCKGIRDGFLELKNGEPSTLLKLIQTGAETTAIGDEFLHWIYIEGTPSAGLCSRRSAERTLFLTPSTSPGPAAAPDSSHTSGAAV
jgi:lysozyme